VCVLGGETGMEFYLIGTEVMEVKSFP
jgi:hypothetical protein